MREFRFLLLIRKRAVCVSDFLVYPKKHCRSLSSLRSSSLGEQNDSR